MPGPDDPQAEDLTNDKLLWHLPRSGFGRPMLGGIPLLRRLGKGAMGAVYFAHHPRLKIDVAIKILPYTLVEEEPQLLERFLSEGRMAASLHSDHLVRVLDVNRDGESNYIVMEFVDGETAKAYFRRVGTPGIPERDALDIVIAATRGLAVAHAKRIVHRDVKPDNILIPGGILAKSKLADLGLAKGQWGGESIGTKSQALLGTPGFMSPEQIAESRTVEPTADIFAMGATLQTLLTSQPPYHGETLMKIVAATLQKEPEPLPTNVNSSIAAIVARCLARDPRHRFPDATALLGALERAETGSNYKTEWLPDFKPIEPATQPSVGTLPDAKDLPPPPSPAEPARSSRWLLPTLLVLTIAAAFGLWRYLATMRERAWEIAKREAEAVELDQVHPADYWEDAVTKFKTAAAFGRDPSMDRRLAQVSGRLAEERVWSSLTTADAPTLLRILPQLRSLPSSLHETEAAERLKMAQLAAAGEWEKALEAAERGKAKDYAAAIATLDAFGVRFQGTDFHARAEAKLTEWIDADWAALLTAVRALEEKEDYVKAADRVALFIALPHDGKAAEAEQLHTRMRNEADLTIDGYLKELAVDPRLEPGCAAYFDGDFARAITIWSPYAVGYAMVFPCICSAAVKLAVASLQQPTQEKVAALLAALRTVEKLDTWPRLAKLRDRAEREDIPDAARDAWNQAQAIAASAGDDADRWCDALTRYQAARPGLIPNPHWRAAAEKAVTESSAKALALLRARFAYMKFDDVTSVRSAWRAVTSSLKIAPTDTDLLAMQKKIQEMAAFAPVFAWEDALRAMGELSSPLARLERIALYESKQPGSPFKEEVAAARARADAEAFEELSQENIEIEERTRMAERYARISPRGALLLESLRAERVYRDAMAKAASRVQAQAWKESYPFFEEALKAKPRDAVATAALNAAQDGAARDPRGWVERQSAIAHSGAVRSLAWSPDGQTLISASEDQSAKLWDRTGKHLKTLSGHTKDVTAAAFFPDGTPVTAGEDGVRVWQSAPQELKIAARTMAAMGDRVLLATGKQVVVWDRKGARSTPLGSHSDTVSAIAVGKDLVATGSWDQGIILWDVQRMKELRTLAGHSKAVQALSFDVQGLLLASAGRDGAIVLWDVAERKEARRLAAQAQAVALSPDGTLLAACGSGWVKIWQAQTGVEIRSLAVPTNLQWSIAYSPDGKLLAAGSMDGSLRIWGAKD